MTKDEFYLGKALEEAKKAAAVGEIPIGAVIVHKKKAVARAHNLRETLPCATAHAELLAIAEACRVLGRWRLTGCTLYVTVEPCPMCAGAIVNSRLDRVTRSLYKIVDDERLNHRAIVTAGIRKTECAALLKEFFRKRRAEEKRKTVSD